jgi:hypothetical protein
VRAFAAAFCSKAMPLHGIVCCAGVIMQPYARSKDGHEMHFAVNHLGRGVPLPGGVRLVTCATRTRLMGCTHSRGPSDWSHVRPELDLWVALTPGGCQIGGHGTYRLSSTEPCFDAQ